VHQASVCSRYMPRRRHYASSADSSGATVSITSSIWMPLNAIESPTVAGHLAIRDSVTLSSWGDSDVSRREDVPVNGNGL
jgi:hypothetical protein